MNLKIVCEYINPNIIPRLDRYITNEFEGFGLQFIGSGFNLKTNTRDIEFEWEGLDSFKNIKNGENGMKIEHLIESVDGPFDTHTGKLICVGIKKYGDVLLCFAEGINIPFAKIKLYTRDRAIDADAVFDDAVRLGEEIAFRWNTAHQRRL